MRESDKNFEPKVTDFGMSKFVSNSESASMTANLGTLRYMAPELFVNDHDISHMVDVYGFSMIMYELLF